MIEEWKDIPEFPDYQISNLGRVYNKQRERFMRTSCTQYGHAKISLVDSWTQQRHTVSVARLVARAFVEPPNTPLNKRIHCDEVMILDGNPANVAADNLAWRPRRFVWKYAHQFKTPQPEHYRNLYVRNVDTGAKYDSIMEAGMTEALLFDTIWRSTYSGDPCYPTGAIFEVIGKKSMNKRRNHRL